METKGIHNFELEFRRAVKRVEESTLSVCNKETILQFKDYLLSEGIGYAKISKYLYDLRQYGQFLEKPFAEANEQNIRSFVSYINQKDLSEHTRRELKLIIRKFYCYLRGYKKKGVYPPEVEWISLNIPNHHKKLPEELINEDEARLLIQNSETIRDKALVAVLIESGARVSEIGNLKIKHVSFEQYGARLSISGKTGSRKILVISSLPYIQQWVNNHPKNHDPDSFLWYNPHGELISYARISAILKKSARRAGIKKRIYPHLLRHSRATQFASNMSESAMKQYFGWTQSSKMAGIYVHMSGRDTDELIMKVNGIEIKKDMKESTLRSIKCLKCNTINESTNRFCKLCSFALTKEAQEQILKNESEIGEVNKFMDILFKDKDIMALVAQKIKEVKTI